MQFLHAKVKLEGTRELPHAPLETQMTRTQLEDRRVLASCSWFPEGSAEVPRAYGDMWACSVGVAWSWFLKCLWEELEGKQARVASGWWSSANLAISIRCQ